MDLDVYHDKIAAMEPLARALVLHSATGKSQTIGFRRDDGIWYEQSTNEYFATPEGLDDIEQLIIENVRGDVLDVGAATGRHCLVLQRRGVNCTALDIHPDLVRLMRRRGVVDARCGDFLKVHTGRWHTICFLMDTVGIVGNLDGLQQMLTHSRRRLRQGGQLLLNAEPVIETDPTDKNSYPGELHMQMRFEGLVGEPFPWLYLDIQTLAESAAATGWRIDILTEHKDTGHYLARLCVID